MRAAPWVIAAVLVLAGGLGAWLNGANATAFAARRLAGMAGVEVEAEVSGLGPHRLRIAHLRLGPEEAPGATATGVELSFTLLDLLARRVSGVFAETLEARVVIDEDGARVPGLPSGGGSSSGSGSGSGGGAIAPPMAVALPDARVVIETRAGEIVVAGEAEGDPILGWTARARAEPVELADDGATLNLIAGALEAELSAERADVDFTLQLSELAGGGVAAQSVDIAARFSGSASDPSDLATLIGAGAASVRIVGGALPEEDAAALAAALRPELEGLAAEIAGAHVGALSDMAAAAAAGFDLTAEADIEVRDGLAGLLFDDEATLSAPSLTVTLAPSDGRGVIAWAPAERLWSARDLTLSASGDGLEQARVTLAELSFSEEGGAPSVSFIGAARLDGWRANGLALGLDVGAGRLDWAPDAWSFEGAGEARADGAAAGYEADDAELEFDVLAEGGARGFDVTLADGEALGLRADSVDAAGVELRDVDLVARASAEGGPLASLRDGDLSVAAHLDQSAATFAAPGGRIRVQLPAALARLDIVDGGAPQAEFVAQGPRARGTSSPTGGVTASARVVEASLTLGETPSVEARVSSAALEAAAWPLLVEGADAVLSATFVDAVPSSGEFTLARARLCEPSAASDQGQPRAEPCDNPVMLAPLAVTASAQITDGVARGQAQASFEGDSLDAIAGAVVLGRADFSHNFARGEGEARFASERIAFSPERNGLQPADIIRAAQGMVAAARGATAFEGTASWGADGASAQARLTIEDLDFQTQLGGVEGVNAEIVFADLVDLRTDGAQEITVRSVDPGVVLENGSILINLRGGDTPPLVESALFPFAGGDFFLEPMEWLPGEADQRGSLLARGIDLEVLVAMTETPGLAATGVLDGRLSLIFARADRSVIVDNSFLRARDPGGLISYVSEATETLGASGGQATEIAFTALREFEYDSMEVVLEGNLAGSMTATLSAHGSSPALPAPFRGREINLNVPITAEFANLLRHAATSMDVRETLREAGERRER